MRDFYKINKKFIIFIKIWIMTICLPNGRGGLCHLPLSLLIKTPPPSLANENPCKWKTIIAFFFLSSTIKAPLTLIFPTLHPQNSLPRSLHEFHPRTWRYFGVLPKNNKVQSSSSSLLSRFVLDIIFYKLRVFCI